MLKTKIVLSDGTAISSGNISSTSIISATITQRVNKGSDLTLGSTCAAMFECKIIVKGTDVLINAGDEITVYKVLDDGSDKQIGKFTCEKPTMKGKILSLVAYDRVSWLDKDITKWLTGLTGWPYPLLTFAQMTCQQCGCALTNETIPNGDYMVQKFSASGITGRDIIQWAAQAAGRFCVADANGNLEFRWYTPAAIDIADKEYEHNVKTSYDNGRLIIESPEIATEYADGKLSLNSDAISGTYENGNLNITTDRGKRRIPYYMGSFHREDYSVDPVEKVQIQFSASDVGTVYPDVPGEINTYKITGNYLLTAQTPETLLPIATTIYNQLSKITYVPCKISVPSNFEVNAGNTVQIHGADGKTITAYVMQKKSSGAKDSLESTGGKTRSTTTAVNNRSFEALSGKILDIKTNVDGVTVRVEEVNRNAEDNLTNFADSVTNQFAGIQDQLDGVVETWYGEVIPTLENPPANGWNTEEEKKKHSGDLYYVTGDGPNGGKAYRWVILDGVWKWDKIANSDIAQALEAAQHAQDTADGKRRVFVDTPYTPYDQGDLWTQGASGELMRCNHSRGSGAYVSSDWGVATNSGTKFSEFNQRVDGISAKVTNLETGMNSKFQVLESSINAKVSNEHTGARFGWNLTDTSWEIKANGTSVFKVNEDGAYVSGEIKADKGDIGGIHIRPWGFYTGTSGSYTAMQSTSVGTDKVFAAGINDASGSWANAKFFVQSNGHMHCESAYIEGDVHATSGDFKGKVISKEGNIGGWDIGKKGLEYTTVQDGDYIKVYMDGYGVKLYRNGPQIGSASWLHIIESANRGRSTAFSANIEEESK